MLNTLYILPSILGPNGNIDDISSRIKNILEEIDLVLAENPKTVRSYIQSLKLNRPIQSFKIVRYDKSSDQNDSLEYIKLIKENSKSAIISESGVPAVADPGFKIVKQAHRYGIKVIPISGPSSIILALCASGINGQNFRFIGYLPSSSNERISKIKQLSSLILKTKETQIFIEVPYRNKMLFEDLIQYSSNKLLLNVSINLTFPTEQIITKSIYEWKKVYRKYNLHDKQVIFILGM